MEPSTAPQRAAPVRRLHAPPRAPSRASFTDRLVFRWERLREDQRQRAWGLVEQMRTTLAQERRRRRRLLVAAVLTALALLVVGLLVLALPSIPL
ncbi:MAG TPA: hypothetical protein VGR57_12430 [Ktedonobacterales bacterium]|nr:hypothetical protein [Ktedonobacterales bacterium]